ncbi:unnamed protein product [Clavelina lepadiformis]|uniref:Uncharacterized protein n=1 Tax=Clavelina lepadiformis TaxID=159417 RepID=A0ABP0F9U1_CLALP
MHHDISIDEEDPKKRSEIIRQVYPDYQSGQGSKRRGFITDLANCLILPHMMTRQKIPQLHRATREAMVRCGLAFRSTSLQTANTLQKWKRCSLCPHAKDKKVNCKMLLKMLQTRVPRAERDHDHMQQMQ